jgi:hypothetical protein
MPTQFTTKRSGETVRTLAPGVWLPMRARNTRTAKKPYCYRYEKKLVRHRRTIAETHTIQIDLPTTMKVFGYRPHRTLDEATGNAAVPSDPHRASARRVAIVLLVAALLACMEREISGRTDGSLLAVFAGYVGGDLRHLVSILLNRSP